MKNLVAMADGDYESDYDILSIYEYSGNDSLQYMQYKIFNFKVRMLNCC